MLSDPANHFGGMNEYMNWYDLRGSVAADFMRLTVMT
jgi:hypothetical protein